MKPPLRILHLEDDPRDADLVHDLLEEEGLACRITRVETRSAFLAALEQGDLDLILADIKLPAFDGLEALSLTRAMPREIPFIIFSGTLGEELAIESLKGGATDYVLKQRPARLGAAVRRAIEEVQEKAARIRMQQELSAQDKKFRLLIENLSDGIVLINADGTFIYVSPSTCRITGYEEATLLELKFVALIHPDDVALVGARFAEMIERPGLSLAVDCRFRHNDGSWRWIEAIGQSLLDDPAVAAVVGNFRDITDRRQAEAVLRESEERFRQLTENIREVFWMTDPAKNQMLYVSPAYEQIWGRSPASLYASPLSWLDAIHPDDRNRVLEAAQSKQSEGSYDEEYRILRPDGTLRWIRDRAFPVRDKSGTVCRIAGIAEDQTHQKEVDENLRMAEAQLRQAQKMEAVGRLTGGIAHDFNNLLTVVLAFSDILLRNADATTSQYRQLKEIRKAGERAASLIDQLLAFSRKQVLQPRVLDLNAVIAEIEKLLQRVIGEDVDLLAVLAPELGCVHADPTQIDQIIMNLAVNARDAMPGGGELTIETTNVELDEEYARHHAEVTPGRYVLLAVSDTGCGMGPETLSHVFEPFFTTKAPGKGTGLGLATIYGIVKQSGGHVWVYSEPGRGTTFKIYLPLVEQPADPRAAAGASAAPQHGSETILVVEDEPALRELVRELLEDAGYTVLVAHDSEEAQQLCERHADELKLLLTDVVMPRIGGRELAGQLALLAPGMRVLYMSGYADNALVHDGGLISGMAFLHKPFTEDSLLRKVREVLDAPPLEG